MRRSFGTWPFAALLVLAAGFGFHDLGVQSIWPDEAYSWQLASGPLAGVFTNVLADHVPGYFLLLHFWIKLAGTSPFGMRAMSTLISIAAVSLLMSLVRSLAGRRAALLAGLIAVVNPFLLYYAQEARMYALLLALAALALRLTVELSRRWAPWVCIAYALTVASLLYVHYYAVLLLPVLALAPFVLRCDWRQQWAAIGAGCALFAPWALPHADIFNTFAPVTAGGATFGSLLTDYLLNVNLGQIPFAPERALSQQVVPWLLVAFTLGVALWGAVRAKGRGRVLLALAWVVPFSCALALTIGRRDLSPRHSIVTLTGYVPLMALGVLALPRGVRYGAAILLLGAFLWCDRLYFNDLAYQREDFRGMVQYVAQQAVQGDAFILLSDAPLRPLWEYYAPSLQAVHLALPPSAASISAAIGDADRAHLFMWQDFADDPFGVVKRTLDTTAHPIGGHGAGEIAAYDYAVRDPFAWSLPPGLTSSDTTFSGVLRLAGYREWSTVAGAGLRLQLAWERLGPIPCACNVFVHEVDASGGNLVIADHRPAFDTLDLSQWTTSPFLVDEYDLAGDRRRPDHLEIGLYDRTSGARLSPDSIRLPFNG